MVFGRVADFFSAVTSRLTPAKSSAQYMPTGLSPPSEESIDHGFSFANAGRKSNLRLSSSLQDFSSYRRVDLEGGDYSVGIDRKPPFLQRENAGASFSKEKVLPVGTPFWRKKWVRFFLILLCLLLFAFLTYLISMYVISYWSQGVSKFYVVLDCGSTGTRVYVYQASIDQKKDGNLPIVLKSFTEGVSRKTSGSAYDRMETDPGLQMLVHNTSGLKAALNPLVRWAEKQVPEHARKTTPLFLYATAGVRRLPATDSKWLLDNAWSILKHSPFLIQRKWIKVINGMDEAYYGWIALNYQTGVLGNSPKKATFGALDMGGSSLQVTFESKKRTYNETDLNLRIGAVHHHLSAYSLAGYGLNDAFDKSVVQIMKRIPSRDLVKNGNIEIKHPCLQSGYNEQYICSQCASNLQNTAGPVVAGRNSGNRVKSGVPVQLIGAPNWEECSYLAKVAINLSEWSNLSAPRDCDLQPCALPAMYPRPYGQFYAMSGFFVVFRFFNLTSEASLDDVLEKGQEFCQKTWDAAKSSVPPQPFIEQYCFRAPYIVLLLREGLHITDDHIIIGSGSITWTLGVALFEAGKAFYPRLRLPSYEIFQMKLHPAVVVVLAASLILLICALSCLGNWAPKFLRRRYLPLFMHNSTSAASVLSIPSPFRFQRWSPITSGDGRVKMPLSPTVAGGQQGPFSLAHGLNSSGIQLMESSLYPSTSFVSHSYSSSSLGQMMENNSMGSFWSPHRSQMRLQSRRSQSREDLSSSLAETHMVKV